MGEILIYWCIKGTYLMSLNKIRKNQSPHSCEYFYPESLVQTVSLGSSFCSYKVRQIAILSGIFKLLCVLWDEARYDVFRLPGSHRYWYKFSKECLDFLSESDKAAKALKEFCVLLPCLSPELCTKVSLLYLHQCYPWQGCPSPSFALSSSTYLGPEHNLV